MKWTRLTVACIAIASFLLGFFAHQQQWHDPVRMVMAYAAGNVGGCDLWSMIKASGRTWRLSRLINESPNKVIEETADGFSHWDTPLGKIWSPPGQGLNFSIAEQRAEVYTEGNMALAPNDVVIDCGANIGDFVLVCLRAGVAKVVAIDPSPNNVEALRRSFPAEIARGQVVVVPKGVWHEDSTMTMAVYDNSLLDSFVMRERQENAGRSKPREIQLPVTTIDKIVEELRLEKVTFIKMDIEGAERNAIRGATKTIARFRPRMAIATENLEDDYRAVPIEVQKLGHNYKMNCGLCRKVGLINFKPDILFFTPR